MRVLHDVAMRGNWVYLYGFLEPHVNLQLSQNKNFNLKKAIQLKIVLINQLLSIMLL